MPNDSKNWHELQSVRVQPLNKRFPGHYRALVVETNDPLNMMRIKFKCPDMHDFDLTPEQCPWAVPAPELGGKRAGRFVHPVIGDWVWITFERQHPYGPIWTGFADPTRRKVYTYPQMVFHYQYTLQVHMLNNSFQTVSLFCGLVIQD